MASSARPISKPTQSSSLKGTPMSFIKKTSMLLVLVLFTLTLGASQSHVNAQAQVTAPPLPNPVLYLTDTEPYTANGKNFIRYRYDVMNKDSYPKTLFAAAPALPPCGQNTNSSRSWVDFFDQRGKRLYGFCALGKPEDLGKIWFSVEEDAVPPSYIYIEINDRQTNTKYKSNLAETTL